MIRRPPYLTTKISATLRSTRPARVEAEPHWRRAWRRRPPYHQLLGRTARHPGLLCLLPQTTGAVLRHYRDPIDHRTLPLAQERHRSRPIAHFLGSRASKSCCPKTISVHLCLRHSSMRPVLTVTRSRIQALWMPLQQASALAQKSSIGDVFFVVTSDAGSYKDFLRAALDIEAGFCSKTDSRQTLE